MIDHYATLGLPRSATVDAIVRAWREAASLHHPDRPGGNAEKFKAAREAYDCLMNREARARHDKELSAPVMISVEDYQLLVSRLPWQQVAGDECPLCLGAREVLVDQSGFWNRKSCPACQRS